MKRIVLIFGFVLGLNICFLLPNSAIAQGSLDVSFGIGGKVSTFIGADETIAKSMAIQLDGKIVVVGTAETRPFNDFAVARYNTDGSLDNSFDGDGKQTTRFTDYSTYASAVAIQADGKIVVAGSHYYSTQSDFALARYNTNGSLDVTFGVGGKLYTEIADNAEPTGMAIQADGKIVVVGRSNTGVSKFDITVVRYNVNGSLDASFDGDGILITAVDLNAEANAVAIQADGKIVVAGNSYDGIDYDFNLLRYNTDGSLDNSLDLDGIAKTDFLSDHDYAYSIALQADGKIVLAGSCKKGLNYGFALTRYHTDGSLDNSFDFDGKLSTMDIGSGKAVAYSVLVQSDGKLVAVGYSISRSKSDVTLARYNTDGSLDKRFNTYGVVITPFSLGNSSATSAALQADGKIVVSGNSKPSLLSTARNNSIVARYVIEKISGINNTYNTIETINIYPNPFYNDATLYSNILLHNASLELRNSIGQTVSITKQLAGHEVKIERNNLPAGLYFLQLSEENQVIATHKFIISD